MADSNTKHKTPKTEAPNYQKMSNSSTSKLNRHFCSSLQIFSRSYPSILLICNWIALAPVYAGHCRHIFQFILGDINTFPDYLRYIIPPVSSGSTTVVHAQKTSKIRSSQYSLMRSQNHLNYLFLCTKEQ